jgi:hypothetical protein
MDESDGMQRNEGVCELKENSLALGDANWCRG